MKSLLRRDLLAKNWLEMAGDVKLTINFYYATFFLQLNSMVFLSLRPVTKSRFLSPSLLHVGHTFLFAFMASYTLIYNPLRLQKLASDRKK